MLKRLLIHLALVAILLNGTMAEARPSNCDVCGNRLGSQSWSYNDQICCSQACVAELRPKCAVCGNAIHGEYRKAEGKAYCGQACHQTTLPKCEICSIPIVNGFRVADHQYCAPCMETRPTCFSCGLPSKYPTHLDDGRDICGNCMRWAVTKQRDAEKHYDLARRHLEAWTGLQLESVPKLVLVDRNEMLTRSEALRKTDAAVSIRGFYSRQTMMTKRGPSGTWEEAPELDEENIYLVDHLHDSVFRVAAVHELMHDLVHEHFPRLKEAPLWVHEGISQQAAAEYCRRRNYVDVLYGIKGCEDPDYGDGYRYINGLMGFEGWRALQRWMENVDVDLLPEIAPK